MTRKLSRTLVLCLLLLAPGRLTAQNGPDNDADAAPGYTNSVFHHDEIDSINLYNGQLTLPIALGVNAASLAGWRRSVPIGYCP